MKTKIITYSNLNKVFYCILFLSIIIYSISLIYFKAPYYIFGLAWFYVILSLITILLYILLFILDIKYKNLLIKTVVLIAFIFIFKQMRIYQAKVYENYFNEILYPEQKPIN
jgi:hypothetical protein